MFCLRLRLHGGEPHYGLAALDRCRRYGLPESTAFPAADSYCGANDVQVAIGEDLARRLLSAEQVSRTVIVHPDDCARGEIRLARYHGAGGGNSSPVLALVEGISVARALEFVALEETRKLRKDLADSQATIAKLRASNEWMDAKIEAHRQEKEAREEADA